MAKISLLPTLIAPTGNELVVVADPTDNNKTKTVNVGTLAKSAVAPAVLAAVATANSVLDAAATGTYATIYESVGSTNGATLASNVGVLQISLVNGVHIATGDTVHGVRWLWAAAAAAVAVEVRVFKRNVAVATAAGALNGAAPATGDTLIGTFTTTPAALGVTPGANAPVQTADMIFASSLVVEAGTDLVVQFRNLDAGGAVVNAGYAYRSGAAGTQRRAGFQALTASPATFTNLATNRVPSITLLKDVRATLIPATVANNRTLADQRDAETQAAMNARNVSNLLVNAAVFRTVLLVPASYSGDSLVQDNLAAGGEPGSPYRATDITDSLTDGTVNNYGINGQTAAQITARVVASSAADKAGYNDYRAGTNDLATATSASDVVASVATAVAAFTNPSFVIHSPWANGAMYAAGVATPYPNKVGDIRVALKAAYGAKFFDSQAMWARHGGGASDATVARGGAIAPDLTIDGLHQSKAGGLVKGYELTAALVARAGGAPFVHDDMFGFKAGDAAGTTIGTVRFLGTAYNFRIIAGNEDGAVQINRATGTITRTSLPILQPYRELFVEAENIKGPGRNGRIVLVQQAAGTKPGAITRVVGNGASVQLARSDYAPAPGNELTVVFCARLPRSGQGHIISEGSAGWLTQAGWQLQFAPRGTAGAALGNVIVSAERPSEFNWYFFTIKTDGAVLAGVVNEDAPMTAAPTASPIGLARMIEFFTNTGNTIPWVGDLKMMAIYGAYYDITSPAVRANFYDSATKLPKDIGATGTAGGTLAQPLFYFKGMAGDYLDGMNAGSAGKMHVPVPIGRAHLGFVDVAG